MGSLMKYCASLTVKNLLHPRLNVSVVPNRGRKLLNNPPKKRYPPWLPKQHRVLYKEDITPENTKFIKELIESKYGTADPASGCYSPLKAAPIEPATEWTSKSRRTGVIAKKIGIYPMWLKNGKKVLTTLLQIADNHVIRYIPPEEWSPTIRSRKHVIPKRTLGCLVVGAESVDPQMFTKQYCGLFTNAGVMPKRLLCRFPITPDAALQPGTPLTAAHFKAGEVIDIRAKTMDRGFQGVCKRWGFKGMPATHGVTKTHRRPGNIGSGSSRARVMPGTKLPGHMGNRYRMFRGVRILRVNTKHNVIWVLGQALPGETNSLLHIYDTVLTKRKFGEESSPHFPTYIPNDTPLVEETFADDLHPFSEPSIAFEAEK